MRTFACLVLLTVVAGPVSAADSALPDGAIKKGTLADAQLVHDAKVGVASKVAIMGCDRTERVEPFVAAMPTGPVGQRAWKELWIASGCNSRYPVHIDFKETGQSGVDWTIGN